MLAHVGIGQGPIFTKVVELGVLAERLAVGHLDAVINQQTNRQGHKQFQIRRNT